MKIVYKVISKVSIFILLVVFSNELTEFTVNILDLFLPMIDNSLRITSTYNIVVENECNGQYLLLFFLMISLYYNFELRDTLFVLLVIYIANLFRIFAIYQLLLIYGKDSFFIIHDLIGNLIVLSSVFISIYILERKQIRLEPKKVLS